MALLIALLIMLIIAALAVMVFHIIIRPNDRAKLLYEIPLQQVLL